MNCKNVHRVCQQCNIEFYTWAFQVKKGGGLYCSPKCRTTAISERNKVACICKFCKKIFYKVKWEITAGEGKFCTKDCAYKFRLLPQNKKCNKIKKSCDFCNKTFLATPTQLKNGYGKFCSHNCSQRAYQLSIGHKLIVKGDIDKKCKSIHELFWKNIKFPFDLHGCWEYLSNDKLGYGIINWKYKIIKAHRYSHEKYIGPIPHGLFVCHHCDNPCCVNPKHLYAGTAKDNARDMILRGRTQYIGKGKIKKN